MKYRMRALALGLIGATGVAIQAFAVDLDVTCRCVIGGVNSATAQWIEESVIPAFEAANPDVNVTLNQFGGEDAQLTQQLALDFSTGAGPDVSAFDGFLIPSFVEGGLLKSLDEVVRRFPESAYGRDARLKIELTYDHLAGKEMEVGRYYQQRGHYLAAINRFKVVAEKWQTTNHVPEALHRLIECYLALGLGEEARKTAAVLGHNYPGSEWYVDSYALVVDGALPARERPGFFARAFNSIF